MGSIIAEASIVCWNDNICGKLLRECAVCLAASICERIRNAVFLGVLRRIGAAAHGEGEIRTASKGIVSDRSHTVRDGKPGQRCTAPERQSPRAVTLSGMVMLVRLPQRKNALSPMLSVPSGIV